jgi:phytoene dehydrogenase-like protein
VLIVGAGVAGLSAGIYARMNGYDAHIVEMHDKPGGYCTAWSRKGYTFDYSIHNLSGTLQGSGLNDIWVELGAFSPADIVDHPELVQVEDAKGNKFTVFSSIKKTTDELRRLSPEDEALWKDYEKAASKLAGLDMFAAALGGFWRTLKILPYLGTLKKWGSVSMGEFAKQVHDPFLRQAFPLTQYGISEIPMVIHLVFVSGLDNGDLGWPKGGSLAFAQRMEQRLLSLGGSIEYRARVEKVLVEEGRAVGVRLADGREQRADAVIAACDGHALHYSMLEEKYLTEDVKRYYEGAPDVQSFGLQVSLGVNRDLSSEPHALVLILDEPLEIESRKVGFLNVEVFGSVTKMAPEGKGVIKVIFDSSYRYWAGLAKDPTAYKQRKQEVADAVIKVLEKRFPGLGGQVEAVDVCTMLTAERFTGNYHGLQPWDTKKDALELMRNGLSRTVPGVSGLYCAGQWAEGMVGLSTAALSGRRTVQSICKADGKKFKTDAR